MQKIITTIILLFLVHQLHAQDNSVFKLFLVGDAGENQLTGATLDSLKNKLLDNPNSAVVFLGDNSYKKILWVFPGFKGFDSSKVTQKKVLSQLSILNNYHGSVFFVPGNHDWWNTKKFEKGKRKLKMEESFIEAILKENTTIKNPDTTSFLPSNGNPGPAFTELDNERVRIIFIDTEWFLLLGFKKTPAENILLEKNFYQNLDSIVADSKRKGQRVIVTGHHPLFSEGPYAKALKHPDLFKRIKYSYMASTPYKSMIKQLNGILEKYPGIYYACGHVHALQYFTNNGVNYIVSGSGSKTIHISKKKSDKAETCSQDRCIVWNEQGFFEMDFSNSKEKVIMYHLEKGNMNLSKKIIR